MIRTAPKRERRPLGIPPGDVAATLIEGIAEEEDRLPARPLTWLVLMIIAACVGATAGIVGGGFRIALSFAEQHRTELVEFARANASPWISWVLPMTTCALGAGVGVWLTQRFAPRTAGSGIPRVEAVLRAHLLPATSMILPVKFIGGLVSIGSGLALGREGPTVQMGGTIGRLFSDRLARVIPEPWTLIAAGAGAGLAVAFNAPLAATLFVAEELLHRFSARVFSASLVSCITGTLILRWMLGNVPEFHVTPSTTVHATVLPEYLLLGVVAGILGVAFNVALLGSLRAFDRTEHWPRGMKGALVGAAAGLIAWFAPMVAGGGEGLAAHATTSAIAWKYCVVMLGTRFALTMASYGCGAPGGIFAPILAIGAVLGNLFAAGISVLRSAPVHSPDFVIVSMAACFTSIVRSPLTGIVLLLEMTGDWTLILPMMTASVTAYAVPELLRNPPIYDSLRERDEVLERARSAST